MTHLASAAFSEICFNDFEQLREVVPGTRREIVQIEKGRLSGTLIHANVGDLTMDAVAFSRGVRSVGAYPNGRLTLGLLMASGRDAFHSSFATRPGDVTITPPGGEQENRYLGATSLFVTSISLDELERRYGAEVALASIDFRRRSQFRGDAALTPRIQYLLDRIRDDNATITEAASAFWSTAVVDAMLSQVIQSDPYEPTGPVPAALRIVRSVDDLLTADVRRAFHIADICRELCVSRRSLHRAFHDVVGVGPVTYLRSKRLCTVHSILRDDDLGGRTIESVAFEFGFAHPGRFAYYYRQQFGELPNDTRTGRQRR